jgi:hypothetical protein
VTNPFLTIEFMPLTQRRLYPPLFVLAPSDTKLTRYIQRLPCDISVLYLILEQWCW